MGSKLENFYKAPSTTIAGTGMAGLLYGGLVGAKPPETKGEMIVFGVSALFQLLGILLPAIKDMRKS